ncbi:uncharacterized protein LOC111890821 [Lactuca sativa]|uniref:RING-type E3 ubiquitin transferase n=1 Tax=Lactuca sativa TaxID=4236 RepID=A0A9R1UWR8_LACSA|nr:uncharacterized protein LOC111890821 [Lactuca sativa]KAJ0195241.1 hypothetical protein LSAT_V11C700382950 [Lactuca sativa]
MGQRNMVYTGPMIDNEIEHAHLHPEPCAIPYNQITTFPLPNDHHLPVPPPGITFMAAPPPGARVIPIPVPVPVPGLHNQLTFPSNHGFHGPFKGKITEVFPVNFQYFYPSPTSNPFMVPDYNLTPVIMPPGHQHHRGPITHGVVPGPWLDQPFCSNPPGIPFIPGYANRAPVTFVHPPVPSHQQPPPMPPLRATMDFHPLQNGVEFVPRFVGPAPQFGVRVFPPHQLESTSRPRGFPHLRVLPEDGVAMLDISNYGRRVDHHRDMRMDIDHMSYEELLALGEQIGNAGSGLSEDFISGYLKTRVFMSSKLEVVSSPDQELSFCTICQMEYNDQERIGMLDCSHGYHVDCIKKWLTVKNTCPVCKCTGLTAQGNRENS